MQIFGKTYNRILIVEPHADDAIISMGGTIIKYLSDPTVTLLTFTEPSIYNGESSVNLSKYLPICNIACLGYKDIPFRVKTMKWLKEQLGDAYSAENAFKFYNQQPIEYAIDFINKLNPDLMFLPLGVQHLMHIYVREKLSNLDRNILYYADEPYFSKKRQQPYVETLMKMVKPVETVILDESTLQRKLEVFKKVYPSQWYFTSTIKQLTLERFYQVSQG